MLYVYWEKQSDDLLCGVHCLNSLLQGPYYSEFELAQVAHEMDHHENALLDQKHFTSHNVDLEGNFSL